jgi:hypothetical protein
MTQHGGPAWNNPPQHRRGKATMQTIAHKNTFAHCMLTDQGCFVHTHAEADFDDGDPENGPGTVGYPAFDVYEGDSHDLVIDQTGLIVHAEPIDWVLSIWLDQQVITVEVSQESFSRSSQWGS